MKKIVVLILCLIFLTSCNSNKTVSIPKQETGNAPISAETVSPDKETKPEQKIAVSEKAYAPAPAATESPEPSQETSSQPQTLSVSVTVYGLEGEIIFSAQPEYYEGITAFDALTESAKEKGIPVAFTGSKSSAYVTSIAGLAEKKHGSASGWIYTINSESVMHPCGKCVLSPGDSVEWTYITEFTQMS